MCVFALLDRAAAIGGCVEDFGCEPLFHRLLAAPARSSDQPSHRERIAPRRTHFTWDLIVGAADPPRANLDCGANVVQRALEDDQAVFLRTLSREIQRVIKNLLGQRLLVPFHHDVHELRDGAVVILGVRRNFADAYLSFARHITLLIVNSTYCFTWVSSTRISSGPCAAPERRSNPACRESRDSGRPAGHARDRRESGRQNAPAGCARRPGYRCSPRSRWTAAHAPLSAAPSSASWAWSSSPACIRRVSAASLRARAPWS